ncbi:alpha-ketoacid dehydrogenase kinase [Ceratobasidium sp. AG-Ba]|nr:alpha-ketoacid dehydrogenase kinase [Ceratobasidium sp. AG-Ba]
MEVYAAKPAHRLSLRQLLFFGRQMDETRIIKSANYVRTELPVRIAHRIRDLQSLPYVVVKQEWVAKVYELYWSAFEKLRKYPEIHTQEDNRQFCKFLRTILNEQYASFSPNPSFIQWFNQCPGYSVDISGSIAIFSPPGSGAIGCIHEAHAGIADISPRACRAPPCSYRRTCPARHIASACAGWDHPYSFGCQEQRPTLCISTARAPTGLGCQF